MCSYILVYMKGFTGMKTTLKEHDLFSFGICLKELISDVESLHGYETYHALVLPLRKLLKLLEPNFSLFSLFSFCDT